MRLSTQMLAEVQTILTQVQHITQKIVLHAGNELVTNLQNNLVEEIYDKNIEKLRTYKVRLENLLCETDHKEQDHLHEFHLFRIITGVIIFS